MSSTFCTCILVMSLTGGQFEYGDVYGDSGAIYEEAGSGIGGSGDQLYPYDAPEPWLHGYFQEMPAYAGYAHFRPHNYKHVFSQSQVSAGWGYSAEFPYSHQFWHRYEAAAAMKLHLPEYPTPSDPRRPGQRAPVSDIYQQSYQSQQGYPVQYADPRMQPIESPVYLVDPQQHPSQQLRYAPRPNGPTFRAGR
ncbi:MAG: hypothetical protein ACKVT0_08830 [Planctomycetaceae bacterium]